MKDRRELILAGHDPDDLGGGDAGKGPGLQPEIGSDPTQGKGSRGWQEALRISAMQRDARNRAN